MEIKGGSIVKMKVKCDFCGKKCKMMSFSCKCGGEYCQKHRYTHSHNCKYSNEKKEENKKLIQESNPKVSTTKVVGI